MSILPKSDSGGHNERRLIQRILGRSFSDTWETAKREWELTRIFWADPDEPGTCLCGHRPIIEHCLLTNRLTNATALVGNVCVGKFDLPSDEIFRGFNRIARNPEDRLSAPAVQYCRDHGWLTGWEISFLTDKRHKRSSKVLQKRRQINEKLLRLLRVTREEVAHA